MPFDPNQLGSVALIVTAFAAAFLLALWISLIIWTWRDVKSRTNDVLLRILSLLIVAVLFVPGVLVYLVLRPTRTLEEEYQRTLEEEALLRTIEDTAQCPGCSRRVEADWVACPQCHTILKKRCPACDRLMEIPWNLCPYCGTPSPGMRKENVTLEDAVRALPTDEGEEIPSQL